MPYGNKTPDRHTGGTRSRDRQSPVPYFPQTTSQDKERAALAGLNYAKTALHGKNIHLRDNVAEAIFEVLEELRFYFQTEVRAAIANKLSEEASYAKKTYPDDTKEALVAKMDYTISNSLDWRSKGIPQDIAKATEESIKNAIVQTY
ncbi:MAG: hypothetical protein NTZ25_03860 [Candidatus Peregrinibacteria bacterium]|nr:hypothetical protein [Candidatus Peregrinibacteria bacterium]